MEIHQRKQIFFYFLNFLMCEEEMIAQKHHLEVKIITKKGAPNILLKDCNSIAIFQPTKKISSKK